jgi:beta-mannanase
MNGNWYPWGGAANDNNPALYVTAWRHVHDLFVAQGATNVAWVWSPNASDNPSGAGAAWNHWTNYYPGDAYVDWVAIDGYNWGTTQSWSSWQTFANIFGNGTSGIYTDYAATKPIMIAETASATSGAPAGTSKAQWITDMATATQNLFPSIEAVLWFDTTSTSGVQQWPIDTSTNSLSAYTAAGQLSYFKPPVNWDLVGDINKDGKIDIFDLSTLLSNWGATGGAADINQDGSINIFDLSILLSHWSP